MIMCHHIYEDVPSYTITSMTGLVILAEDDFLTSLQGLCPKIVSYGIGLKLVKLGSC